MEAKRMEVTTRFGVKLTAEERAKLILMATKLNVSESEVLRTLIIGGTVIEKPEKGFELLTEIHEKLSRMTADFDHFCNEAASKNNSLESRVQELEDVLVSEIVERQPVSQPSQIDPNEPPTLTEFSKQFTAPAMPSQLESFKEMVKQEYIKKFGVSPT